MIVDVFPFFDEVDLLEVRLNELKDIVDVFVLTESTHTFTGKDKPLYFRENRRRFQEFNIVHPVYVPSRRCKPMEYERQQKQFNLDRAFDLMSPGDVMILGDVDEIPRASVVTLAPLEEWDSAGLVMTLFYYYMNCRSTVKKVRRDSRLLRYSAPFEYNLKQNEKVDKMYYDAGWHFSFLGDVKTKIAAWGHAPQYDKPPYNDPEHIRRCSENGEDIFMRKGRKKLDFAFTSDLSYLPQYVQENMEKFKDYIK